MLVGWPGPLRVPMRQLHDRRANRPCELALPHPVCATYDDRTATWTGANRRVASVRLERFEPKPISGDIVNEESVAYAANSKA